MTWNAATLSEGEWVWRGEEVMLEDSVEESAVGAVVDAKVYNEVVVW